MLIKICFDRYRKAKLERNQQSCFLVLDDQKDIVPFLPFCKSKNIKNIFLISILIFLKCSFLPYDLKIQKAVPYL